MITVDFKHTPLTPGAKVLDVGCGSGRHTCAAYGLTNVTAVGADIDAQEIREARRRLQLHEGLGAHGGGRWCVTVADIRRLPFPDAHFDLVICSEVLEHLADESAAIAEIVRVLKPGCALVVSVPRRWPEAICWALSPAYRSDPRGHVRIYRAAELTARLELHGLKRRAAHHAHSLHTPYWWLKCLVGPQRDDHPLVALYHRFLTWDILQRPTLTRWLDRLLNPVLGKSLVVYFDKPAPRI